VFGTLNRTNLFALGFRVGNMKTVAGRVRKIEELVRMLERGETIVPQVRPVKKHRSHPERSEGSA
jgi:uncharacterized protein YdeI (YjbR/CyaY-like superfamily)